MRTKLLLRLHRDRTALSNRPRTPYSQSNPHRMTRGTQSNTFSKSTKHMWIGWATPIHPPAPWKGYRAGPVFHDREENRTVLPESKVLHWPNSPLQYPGIEFPGEAEECDPPVIGTHTPVPLLIKRDQHPGLPGQRHCPWPPRDAAEACQPRQPHHIQTF